MPVYLEILNEHQADLEELLRHYNIHFISEKKLVAQDLLMFLETEREYAIGQFPNSQEKHIDECVNKLVELFSLNIRN